MIIKRLILFLCCLFIFISSANAASSNVGARIGNNYYDTLEDAITASTSSDTIVLTNDAVLDKTLEINKTVNIDLNNHNIEGESKVFVVQGGSLNISGKGTIREKKPYYGAIMLLGSDDEKDEDFTTISVGKDVTLEGWSGIFVNHENNTAYGIRVNMNGNINAVNDVDGGVGIGIYVNGNIKHIDNSPIISLSDTVNIKSTGNGIYAAGYAYYSINGAYIEGNEAGLAIKSGKFNIIDATIVGTGEDKTPTSGNNNGINPSGAAIQIESNNGYKGDIELAIKDGEFTSKKGNSLYEYIVNDNDTKVKDISISGGLFTSGTNKDDIRISDSLKATHQGFITGGKFTSDVSEFVAANHDTVKDGNLYEVVSSTMNVFSTKDNNEKSTFSTIVIIISLIIIGVIAYLNRGKIFSFIK